MRPKKSSLRANPLLASLIVMFICAGSAHAAQGKYHALYRFQGDSDGAGPNGTLVVDQSGNLYGVTSQGGTGQCQSNGVVVGCGTVFELSPPAEKGMPWTKTLLYDFQGPDGDTPVGGLVADAEGNLYGTTEFGGNGYCNDWQIPGCGIIFELGPGSSGTRPEAILYNFQGSSDGEHPVVGLAADSLGNLYGTTTGSSGSGPGVVFELSPSGGGSWSQTVLYTSGYGQGSPNSLYAGLILDSQGNLYTTSVFGGTYDAGTVFELSPPKQQGGAWTETNLYNFHEAAGDGPNTPVVFDRHGNLYGTLFAGGAYGSVFELSPPKKKGGSWTEKVLYDFGGSDGVNPFSGLILDKAGNLYSNTYGDTGVWAGSQVSYGSIYRLKPQAHGAWAESTLHQFKNHPAEHPVGQLAFGAKGKLYGAAALGDKSAPGGVVFEIPSQ